MRITTHLTSFFGGLGPCVQAGPEAYGVLILPLPGQIGP